MISAINDAIETTIFIDTNNFAYQTLYYSF